MNINLIEYIATILSIIGSIYVARINIKGYYIWIIANIIWIVFGIINRLYGVITTFIFFQITSIYGLIIWKNNKLVDDQ